jgi:hypothetical protein
MSTIMRCTIPGLLAITVAGSAMAQESRTEVACDDHWTGGNPASSAVCEIRELTLTQEESLQIDGSPNGSVTVTGSDRNEIQVRAHVRSWDRDQDTARGRLDQIEIATDREIKAHGPQVRNSWWRFGRQDGGWNVDLEIMAPYDTDLWIESVNGAIAIAAIRGHIDAETVNGSISLTRVSAGARGSTVNGGISAELEGDTIDGDALDLRTVNGGILLRIPEHFSARLDVETVNGGVSSDFPVTREGNRNREISATLGSGGALIRARTVNGGVQIRQL